jgi:hypothetical protein
MCCSHNTESRSINDDGVDESGTDEVVEVVRETSRDARGNSAGAFPDLSESDDVSEHPVPHNIALNRGRRTYLYTALRQSQQRAHSRLKTTRTLSWKKCEHFFRYSE